ncbi:helix-turn-helix domain-containing protein [bacterium]|nr:helix-turn-helix domain-containing protein [bacterium]
MKTPLQLRGEIWKKVKETDDKYEISNFGRVKSFNHKKEGKFLTGKIVGGYQCIDMRIDDKRHNVYVHKLVAQYFVPKDNKNKSAVVHIDWNKKNNHYKNLKWATHAEVFRRNEKKYKKVYNAFRGSNAFNSKISKADVRSIRKLLSEGIKQKKIAKKFKISEMQITRIKRHDNWKDV